MSDRVAENSNHWYIHGNSGDTWTDDAAQVAAGAEQAAVYVSPRVQSPCSESSFEVAARRRMDQSSSSCRSPPRLGGRTVSISLPQNSSSGGSRHTAMHAAAAVVNIHDTSSSHELSGGGTTSTTLTSPVSSSSASARIRIGNVEDVPTGAANQAAAHVDGCDAADVDKRITVGNILDGDPEHAAAAVPSGTPPPIYVPRVSHAFELNNSYGNVRFGKAVMDADDADSYFESISLSDFRDPEDCCDPCMACCGCLVIKRLNKGSQSIAGVSRWLRSVRVVLTSLLVACGSCRCRRSTCCVRSVCKRLMLNT